MLMQGCTFYQISKQCAPGSVFNLMGCWKWEKFCVTALCEYASYNIPSHSISQSSKTRLWWVTLSYMRHLILSFLLFNLFVFPQLILTIISWTVDSDQSPISCIISMPFPIRAANTWGCSVKHRSGAQLNGGPTTLRWCAKHLWIL